VVIVCSHSTSVLSGTASHQTETDSVAINVGDGIAVDETDKPSPQHTDHSRNGRVSTLFSDRYIFCGK